MGNILLVDADSKIPNIALMKLSTFHKNKGDLVDFKKLNISYYPGRNNKIHYLYNIGSGKFYDKIYCSVIFDTSMNWIMGEDNVIFGGTGYSLDITLPDEVENLLPDYSLYPENDISYGFISRGCIRKCKFCKVPKKEGYIKQVNNINDIVFHNKVKFLDNNFLALPNHKIILQELINKKIRCQFNQGLDIRLIDNENSILLSKLKYIGNYIFAFDNWDYKSIIDKKLNILSWRKDWQLKFFVYCHPDMSITNINSRIKYLHDNKCLPYIMRDISCWKSDNKAFYTDLACWANQPNLFKKMPFLEFLEKRHVNLKNAKERINMNIELYRR